MLVDGGNKLEEQWLMCIDNSLILHIISLLESDGELKIELQFVHEGRSRQEDKNACT